MALRLFSTFCLCLALVACSSNPPGNSRADYKKAVSTEPLDVPPPMKEPVKGADGLDMPASGADRQVLLPQASGVRLVRDGDVRWLVVDGAVEKVWPQVQEFWKKEGFAIEKTDPRVGVLETQWAENRADIPESFLRGLFSKLAPNAYGAHTRDKFRTRVERGIQPGTTEVYLTHYGVEQVTRDDQVVWQPRASDPELVAEMMSRFMLYLGVSEERSKAVLAQQKETTSAARLDGNRLTIAEGFARAWRLTGIALDRIGLVVEDLDRGKGIYYVRLSENFAPAPTADEEKGWFSGWFSSEEKSEERRFRVVVQGNESTSQVALQNQRGEPIPAKEAKFVLSRLQEQLR